MKTDLKRVRLQTGDVLQIPLPNNEYAVGHVILLDLSKEAPLNPLLRILKTTYSIDYKVDLDVIDFNDELFPPIIVGVIAAVKSGGWMKIGNRPVKNFSYPKFIGTNWSPKTGKAGIWYLIDNNGEHPIGMRLPNEYKSFEYQIVYAPDNVVVRIITGEIPFPYGDLINYNKFTPRE